ncbi:MAG: VWA domain-containing protein [Acidobacteriaceae bacterium]|nr:VWA domain-containing protein [Acidobacteriaceae bacterium]MBV9441387.1 VWA domain-containing protein [Acidobacteriaceae bacterium]
MEGNVSRGTPQVFGFAPLGLFFIAVALCAHEDPAVFKSDVAMTRVDAQVVDRDGRAITGLVAEDFVLRLNGRVVPIRNFASENMPIDIVLLLDVSGSMQPHVERIASASHQALRVLAPKDRVAIMVFDTSTRVRLPFSSEKGDVTEALDHLIRKEHFNGGTHITRALIDAANYLRREGRQDARHAVVILTDDETQDQEDETSVETALDRANAVLSFLQAPYEVPQLYGGGRPRGPWGSNGGGWPGGGPIGFPGGGPIVLGPGRGGGGGYGGMDRSHTAGTATIARDSGGDVMQVDDASALQDTLARLRQRYALFFYMPEGSQPGDRATVEVNLSGHAARQYEMAEIRYRRVFMSGMPSGEPSRPTLVTRTRQQAPTTIDDDSPATSTDSPAPKHRSAPVNEDSGPRINTVTPDSAGSTSDSNTDSSSSPPPSAKTGGWPRAGQPKPPQ